jgi:Uma2 family endonuclease
MRLKEARMALHDRPTRLTYDDFVLFPEDGLRHEILDGEHYVSAAPYLRHQAVLVEFTTALHFFLKANPLGELFPGPVDVLLSRHDIVEPDLVFVSNERLSILTEKNIQGPPDLVVEVLSNSTKHIDQGLKLERYERFGVQEYWIVDPDRNTITVYRLEGERFQKAAVLSTEDVLRTPLLPGLELQLTEIFG